MKSSKLNLNRLFDFAKYIERDSDSSLVDLQHRDREIGITAQQHSKKNMLLYWLTKMEAKANDSSAQSIELTISFWMSILGSLFGVITMAGLLIVEDQRPVNVLMFLTLYIGSQALLICITLLIALTPRSDTRLNFFPFENLNPARIFFRRSIRRLSKDVRWEYFTEVSRLALLRWGQVFGMAFNFGGIIAFIVILLFTDRSFGWSSTLNLSDDALYKFTNVLSLPWQFFLPDILISSDIISNTRYQSLQTEFSVDQLALMRQWWPFLFACIIFYGFLPRLILFIVFQFKYNRSLTNTFLHYPGARLIFDRMNTSVIKTKNDSLSDTTSKMSKAQASTYLANSDKTIVINWAEAIDKNDASEFLSALGINSSEVFTAGISLAQNKKAQEDINNSYKKLENIIVAVKAWEPPLQELRDFLDGLNASIHCEILLVPLKGKKIGLSEQRDWYDFFIGDDRIKIVLGGDMEDIDSNGPISESK
ncbi:DUF2868 domain-containing protein [Aurantivibrio infirmus]